VAEVTVVTVSDDDGNADTKRNSRGTQRRVRRRGSTMLEFAVGLGTSGTLIYSKPITSHLGKLTITIGKATVRNVDELDNVSTR